jgi:cold shock CspA family protein
MASGKIKKLVHDKGFGFIDIGNGNDIFGSTGNCVPEE